MLPITHGIWASNSSGFNTFYQDILDYATGQGYTLPSEDQQDLQNDLVESMVNLGVWDNLDVFYVFATDAGSDFARINWIDPNRNYAQLYNTPSFTSNEGYTGRVDATPAYIDSEFQVGVTGANFQNSDASLFVYVFDDLQNIIYGDVGVVATSFGIGEQYAAINTMMPPQGALNKRAEYSLLEVAAQIQTDVATSIGLSHVDRASSSEVKFFKDGSLLATTASTEVAISQTLYVNFLRGRFAADYSERTVSIGGAGGSIASAASDFGTAVTTYMASI